MRTAAINNLEKEQYFDLQKGRFRPEKVIVTVIKGGVKTTLPCGCSQSRHATYTKPRLGEGHPNYKLFKSIRSVQHEFCQRHI